MEQVRVRELGRVVNWEDAIIDAAETDTGMRRSNNQDSFGVRRAATAEAWRQRGHLFMVADGMGAHAVGELASKLACDNVPHHYTKAKVDNAVEALTRAYQEVGALIHGRASANKDFEGMGTTCTTLILSPAGALIGHVGDSRAYRIRQGRIDQLTFDHSLVWELVRRNHLTIDQASRAVPRNVITRSLGPDPTVEVDIEGPHPVEPGDVYVLCSDGLSGAVTDHEIGTLAGNFHPDDACRYLTHLANLRGGHDNITTLVIRVGPWAEPGTDEWEALANPPPPPPAKKEGLGTRLTRLLPSLHRKAEPEPVEEHRYVSLECPIDEAVVEPLTEVVRTAQALAVEQAWSLDWPLLAAHRREAELARQAGRLRDALRALGEATVVLGVAGRLHKKDQGVA